MKARDYRVFKEVQIVRPGSYQEVYTIREVDYDTKGNITQISEPVVLCADFIFQLQEDLSLFKKALEQEVLEYSMFVQTIEEW